jgi:hypothetical protein
MRVSRVALRWHAIAGPGSSSALPTFRAGFQVAADTLHDRRIGAALDLLEKLPFLEPDVHLKRRRELHKVFGSDYSASGFRREGGDESSDRRVVVERSPNVRVGRAEEREYELLLLFKVPRGLAFEECEERVCLDECFGRVGARGAAQLARAGEGVVMVVGQSDECRVALYAAVPRGLAAGTGAPLRMTSARLVARRLSRKRSWAAIKKLWKGQAPVQEQTLSWSTQRSSCSTPSMATTTS